MNKNQGLENLKNYQTLHNTDADDLRDSLLRYLEQKVGIRDISYKIERTVYHDSGPMTYYPCGYDANIINIVLTPDTQRYPQKKLFQVSHEVVHLLNPAKGVANNLEEGFASWFSVHVCEYLIPRYTARQYILKSACLYKKQFELMEKITDPFDTIKMIRGGRYTMCNVPMENLNKCANQKCNKEEIKFLLQAFN